MALENLVAYAVVLGVPLWLVAEELVYRFAPRHRGVAGAPVKADAPSVDRRAPEHAAAPVSSL